MPITHDQKATVGQLFLAEIERRVELREKAKKELPQAPSQDEIAKGLTEDLEKRFPGITSVLGPVTQLSSDYRPRVEFKSGIEIDLNNRVPLPTHKALNESNDKTGKRRRRLCEELELLHALKSGNTVAGFQSYVARLWSPADKTDLLPRTVFTAHFDAFCDSKRGFTCSLK